jgi:uncharacterized protein (TIGR00369 family)
LTDAYWKDLTLPLYGYNRPVQKQSILLSGGDMKFEGSIEFSIIERADDRVVSEMPIRTGIKNPFGVVHVGAILWLADVTATVLVMGSAQASEGMKGFPLAITLNANFIGNQTDGMFTAVSSFVKRGHTVSIVRTLVHGANEKLIADVTTNHVLSK